MKKEHIFFLLVLLFAVIQGLYYYPLLPENMPAHFNFEGKVDRWDLKDNFFKIYYLTFGLMVFIFSGIYYLTKRLPDKFINLPNKAYWLAPERRKQTLERLANKLLVYASVTMLYIVGIFHLAFRAGLSKKYTMPSAWFWGITIALFVFVVFWTVSLIRGFKKPDSNMQKVS